MSDNPFDNDVWKKQPPPYTPTAYNPPPYYPPQNSGNFTFTGAPADLEGSKTAYVCGIIGIIMFWNPIGVVLNMIALVKGGTGMSLYERMKDRYTYSSFRKASSGRSMGLTGLILFGILYLGVVLFTSQMR